MTDETHRNRSLRTVALLAGTGIGVLQLNAVCAAESESAEKGPERLEKQFFGERFTVGDVRSFKPDILVDRRTEVTVGEAGRS